MSDDVSMGFEASPIDVLLNHIAPSRVVAPGVKRSKKYHQIATSIREIGVIEPLVLFRTGDRSPGFVVLDGHLRLEALNDAGAKTAPCLIAKDDEAFTYNKRVNRVSSLEEHKMIARAIENGASEAKIAKALGVNVARVRAKKSMFEGICDESVDILKDHSFSTNMTAVLRKVKSERQVEMVRLMVATNNVTVPYAKALLMATPEEDLRDPSRRRASKHVSEGDRVRMEGEMTSLHRQVKAVEGNYGSNALKLVVANGYLNRVLSNERVSGYLRDRHEDLYSQLEVISQAILSEKEPSSSSSERETGFRKLRV